ncbi:MAG: FG-GAP-like repeat-containing protein, partial [Planctomycetales bacterium]|nr:FG-GAP-like repeat-containing protein [Planctomycetales bacterium]
MAFDPIASYAVGPNPQALATGDFNGDGHVDLVTANSDSNTVSVLVGNANGTFVAARDFATGANPRSLAVGDFNGDGKMDVVTGNYGGSDLSVLLGNGDGTLAAPQSVQLPGATNGERPLAVAVGDFNADGRLDLLATSQEAYGFVDGSGYGGWYYQGKVHVILGHGDGSFAVPNTFLISNVYPTAVAVADFNADGNADVVIANSDVGTVSVLLGNGDGTLGFTGDYAVIIPGSRGLGAVTVGDFTGDGILDIATGGQPVLILPGLGNGTFRPVTPQFVDPSHALAVADFNSDGNLDMVTAVPWGSVSVLLGFGTGMLTLPINCAAVSRLTAMEVGDFNGDGRPDVAAASDFSDDVVVLLNDGMWLPLDTPSLSINDVTVVEGNTGTVEAAITVTLSASSSQEVTVHYATGATPTGSQSTVGVDYQAASGTLTFAPGETSKTITVLINGDRLVEETEAFVVNLSGASNALIADGQGFGTIVDDEPRISISDVSKAEGKNRQTTLFAFTVTLSAPYDQPVTVSFRTMDGTATTSNGDYIAKTGTLTFAPGETTKTITIDVKGDSKKESNET